MGRGTGEEPRRPCRIRASGAQVPVWSLPTESGHSGRCADVEPWLFFSR